MNSDFLNILYQPLSQFEANLYDFSFLNLNMLYAFIVFFIDNPLYISDFCIEFFHHIFAVLFIDISNEHSIFLYKKYVESLYNQESAITFAYIEYFMIFVYMNSNSSITELAISYCDFDTDATFDSIVFSPNIFSFLSFVLNFYFFCFIYKIALIIDFFEIYYQINFEIYTANLKLVLLDTSITKFHLASFFILLYFMIFLIFCFKNPKYYFRNWNIILFGIFDSFLSDTIIQQLGIKRGQKFSIFLKSIFFLILFGNIFGLIPFSFTITSHLIYTFSISFSIWLGITLLALYLQGFGFFKLFVPGGAPVFLLILLVPIEILSYVARCLSLAIRLFANMMSGHTLLNILSGFVIKIASTGLLFIALIPFIVVMAVSVLEVGIAFLQAYVFVVLVCIYLKDSFEVSH